MLTFLTPLLDLQTRFKPPHTPRHDRRYGWGHANQAYVVVNGKRLAERAIIRDNRVQVPMRPIFEALGATVRWYPETRKVVGHKGNKVVSLILGQNFAYNPRPVTLDYPPRMFHGRVMVPLRFVSETMGARVHFDRRTKTARVDLPMRGD